MSLFKKVAIVLLCHAYHNALRYDLALAFLGNVLGKIDLSCLAQLAIQARTTPPITHSAHEKNRKIEKSRSYGIGVTVANFSRLENVLVVKICENINSATEPEMLRDSTEDENSYTSLSNPAEFPAKDVHMIRNSTFKIFPYYRFTL